MIRFIDLRPFDAAYRFAFLDTITGTFVEGDGEQAWSSWESFADAIEDVELRERCRTLTPTWALAKEDPLKKDEIAAEQERLEEGYFALAKPEWHDEEQTKDSENESAHEGAMPKPYRIPFSEALEARAYLNWMPVPAVLHKNQAGRALPWATNMSGALSGASYAPEGRFPRLSEQFDGRTLRPMQSSEAFAHDVTRLWIISYGQAAKAAGVYIDPKNGDVVEVFPDGTSEVVGYVEPRSWNTGDVVIVKYRPRLT